MPVEYRITKMHFSKSSWFRLSNNALFQETNPIASDIGKVKCTANVPGNPTFSSRRTRNWLSEHADMDKVCLAIFAPYLDFWISEEKARKLIKWIPTGNLDKHILYKTGRGMIIMHKWVSSSNFKDSSNSEGFSCLVRRSGEKSGLKFTAIVIWAMENAIFTFPKALWRCFHFCGFGRKMQIELMKSWILQNF